MKIEIIEFLLPQLDWIQAIFFLLIFGATISTMVAVRRQATPQNWENNWHNGTQGDKSDDLDAEHGSVHDISQAVATKPEQLADVMPGILLVIGLLGTFLGLGIALNKASAILMDASANGMDDAMSNLMGMMQGLGTKFKTSTWGIIAFLWLKIWVSNNGFDERRLRWTAQKMKHELDDSRSQLLGREHAAQREFVTSISELGDKICTALIQEFTEHRDVLIKETAETRQLFRIEIETDRELLQKEFANQHSVLQRSQAIQDEQRIIARETADSEASIQKILEIFAVANSANIQSVRTGISELGETVCKTLEEQKQIAQKSLEHGTSMRQALDSFVSANSGNMESMRNSSEKMAASADKVGASATELGTAIHSFQTNISEVMNVLKQDLKSTIDDMNYSFKSNMSEISINLVGATNNISQAVGTLSGSVEKTMSEVKNSIGESLNIQKKTQAVFGETSLTLNTNVEEMTQLIKQLCEKIESGLQAVSESGRRMVALNTRYQNVSESAENIAGKLEELSGEISAAVSRLQSPSVNVSFDPLLKTLENIREDIESQKISAIQSLSEVKNSIRESITIQKNTQTAFGESSLTLNNNVEEMAQLIKRLCDKIATMQTQET